MIDDMKPEHITFGNQREFEKLPESERVVIPKYNDLVDKCLKLIEIIETNKSEPQQLKVSQGELWMRFVESGMSFSGELSSPSVSVWADGLLQKYNERFDEYGNPKK